MRLGRLVGGGAEWGAGAGLENLGAKARASDLVLWAVGATARFSAGERLVRLASNAHRLCCVISSVSSPLSSKEAGLVGPKVL